jgi:DNA-binding response OmpR family regulator
MSGTRQLSGMRVLLVEDNYLLAADAREWLESAGAKVIGPTPDAGEACRLIDAEAIDRAVLDINLGEGPGWEIASRLIERKIPFLFATGYDGEAIPEDFRSAPRIEKPFRGDQLVRAVGALK